MMNSTTMEADVVRRIVDSKSALVISIYVLLCGRGSHTVASDSSLGVAATLGRATGSTQNDMYTCPLPPPFHVMLWHYANGTLNECCSPHAASVVWTLSCAAAFSLTDLLYQFWAASVVWTMSCAAYPVVYW